MMREADGNWSGKQGMSRHDARQFVEEFGPQLLQAHPEIASVGIGAFNGGDVRRASSYQLHATTVQPPESTPQAFLQAAVGEVAGPEVAENLPILFRRLRHHYRARPGLNVPSSMHRAMRGSPPPLNLSRHFETLRCGIGIANPNGYPDDLSVGTIGFFVRTGNDTNSEKIYLVSNNHVLGRANDAVIGEPIIQPGSLDITKAERWLMPHKTNLINNFKIAKLSGMIPIDFSPPNHNTVDLAWAELCNEGCERPREEKEMLARVGLGGVHSGSVANLEDSLSSGVYPVYKAGRTTGWTEGYIYEFFVYATVKYGDRPAVFKEQLVIKATADNNGFFSGPGDSGAAVFDAHHNLLGLIFAGAGDDTLVNPAAYVVAELTNVLVPLHLIGG